MEPAAARPKNVSPGAMLALLAAAFAIIAGSAMLRTSASFDEIVFMAVGARGFHLGDFSLAGDHPRLPQYLYGLPIFLSGVAYPPESVLHMEAFPRYVYSRTLLWGIGNPAEHLIMLTRLVGLAFGTATVASVFLLARRHRPAGAALFGAALAAFLPDMLAHSGVAYNDIPLALVFLLSLYAIDAAAREAAPGRVVLAALACAFTVCVKYSGMILGPAVVALVALEALSGRWREPSWRRSVAIAVPLFVAVAWLAIALVYLGDWSLAEFRDGLRRSLVASAGRNGNLFGELYAGGRWYFFPVAFLLKTPAALHVLILLAAVAAAASLKALPWRAIVSHPARAPAVGVALFVAGLVTSSMNIGFRHALPMLPPVCILVAQGVSILWRKGRPALRAALGLLLAAYVASTAMHYPYFLSYVSEYASGRPLYDVLVDSSTDWGEGLPALRTFMQERGVDRVALGFFGSAPPVGYGIQYVPLPSYFTLPPSGAGGPAPRYLVVSATLIAGEYVPNDPYSQLRRIQPTAVIGGSLYVYDMASR